MTHYPVIEVEKFRSALENVQSRCAYTILHADDVSKPLNPKLWRWSDSEKQTSPLFLLHSKTPKLKCQSSLNSQKRQNYESSAPCKMGNFHNSHYCQCSLFESYQLRPRLQKKEKNAASPLAASFWPTSLLCSRLTPTIHLHRDSCTPPGPVLALRTLLQPH